jgi:Zn-dependent peptidase ImmA (M78 family)
MQVGTLDEDFEWLCYKYGICVRLVENIGGGVRGFCYYDGQEYHVILNNRQDVMQQRKTVIHEVIHIMENHFNHPKHDAEKCEEHVAMIIQELRYEFV